MIQLEKQITNTYKKIDRERGREVDGERKKRGRKRKTGKLQTCSLVKGFIVACARADDDGGAGMVVGVEMEEVAICVGSISLARMKTKMFVVVCDKSKRSCMILLNKASYHRQS